MKIIGLPISYGHVEKTPDLDNIIEIEITVYEPDPNIIKDDYHEKELDDRELERQRNEYLDSIKSPVLPPYKPK